MERTSTEVGTRHPTLDGESLATPVAWPLVGHRGRWASEAHALFYGTLLIALLMIGWKSSTPRSVFVTELAVGTLLPGWYWWWIVRRSHELVASPGLLLLYFGAVAILWAALLWLEPTYELLSFSVFAQLLGYLPWRTAIVSTALGDVLVHLPPAMRSGGIALAHKERILPSGTMELVVNLRDDEVGVHDPLQPERCRRFSGAVISGSYSSVFVVDAMQHESMLGVHFTPGELSCSSACSPAS